MLLVAANFDDFFKFIGVRSVAGDAEFARDNRSLKGVTGASFLFGSTPEITIDGAMGPCPVELCPIVLTDPAAGEKASNLLVREMHVFARLMSLADVFAVAEGANVLFASTETDKAPWHGVVRSKTGVLNLRFLMGVFVCGVPRNVITMLSCIQM